MQMNSKKGFTLIELLIVVVIIGILAAIAIPKFASTKEKAYLASMKSDLRNLATAEEAYFSDNQVYLAGTASNIGGTATELDATTHFVPSAGVTVTAALSGNGWNATATHSATSKGCDIFMGDGSTSAGVATVEGEPKCDP
ncbi:MAG TPA: type II secretion system protein [Gemmatimonadaceae bacterium]|nr:type II secretion system protein [Gemmatimonadaceae bacterium]